MLIDAGDSRTLGLDESRWGRALGLAEKWCREDAIPAMGVLVGRTAAVSRVHLFGRQRLAGDSRPVRPDAIFLVASITKPIVATAALILVERGELSLAEKVCDIIPEFGGTGRYAITVRHLLTHTSGLPDMLPGNRELRAAQRPLGAFVEGTCREKPAFAPGCGVQYQSMGFALLGEIVSRLSGTSCAEMLRREIFAPLGMHDTSLGAPPAWFDGPQSTIDRVPEIRLPREQDSAGDWHWNSRYWRSLGAPWGGLLTTPADLGRFAQMMLRGGELDGRRILSPASAAAATRNQLAPMRDVPEEDRRCRPWGYGWRLDWPAHSANFGDLLGPRTYGHWGATGTVIWIDPDRDLFAVILTTQPQEPHGSYLARLSNTIAAADVNSSGNQARLRSANS